MRPASRRCVMRSTALVLAAPILKRLLPGLSFGGQAHSEGTKAGLFLAQGGVFTNVISLLAPGSAVAKIFELLGVPQRTPSQATPDLSKADQCLAEFKRCSEDLRRRGYELFTRVERSPLDMASVAVMGAMKGREGAVSTQFGDKKATTLERIEPALLAAATQFAADYYRLSGSQLARSAMITSHGSVAPVPSLQLPGGTESIWAMNNAAGGGIFYDPRPVYDPTSGQYIQYGRMEVRPPGHYKGAVVGLVG